MLFVLHFFFNECRKPSKLPFFEMCNKINNRINLLRDCCTAPQLMNLSRACHPDFQHNLHARVLAKDLNINDSAGRPPWCYGFMPADFQAKVDSFHEFIENQVTEHNMSPDHIINMDEVCSWSWIL